MYVNTHTPLTKRQYCMLYLVPKRAPVLVVYCDMTNYPQIQQIKMANMISLRKLFLWVTHLGAACWAVEAKGLSWSCSHAISQGYSHLQAWLGLADLLPRETIHMAVGRGLDPLLGVCRRPQFLVTWTSPWGYLSVLPTWQLASPRASGSWESKEQATLS